MGRCRPGGSGEPPGEPIDERAEEPALAPGERAVESQVHGSVWKLAVEVGQTVAPGQVLLVLESMKMEIALSRRACRRVSGSCGQVGSQVAPGQALIIIESRALTPSERSVMPTQALNLAMRHLRGRYLAGT